MSRSGKQQQGNSKDDDGSSGGKAGGEGGSAGSKDKKQAKQAAVSDIEGANAQVKYNPVSGKYDTSSTAGGDSQLAEAEYLLQLKVAELRAVKGGKSEMELLYESMLAGASFVLLL